MARLCLGKARYYRVYFYYYWFSFRKHINISQTKKYTSVTASITGTYRTARVYCKNYGVFWDCTVAAGKGIVTRAKIIIKNKK